MGEGNENQHFQHTQAQNITLGGVLILKHCQKHHFQHPQAQNIAYSDVLSQATIPPGRPFLFENTVKIIIFNLRKRKSRHFVAIRHLAGGPGGIRASNLEASCQNCPVVQRAATRQFGRPTYHLGARFGCMLAPPPAPHTL